VENRNTYADAKSKSIYFMAPIEILGYEETLFKNNEVIIFEQLSGEYFSLIVKSKNNIHVTTDYSTYDNNQPIVSKVFKSDFRNKINSIIGLFYNVEFQLYGVLHENELYFYAIGLNSNIVDSEDTINIFNKFNIKMPKILYSGIFNEKKINDIYETNKNIFIRSDYTEYEPKFVMSLYNKSKKIPNKIFKSLVQRADFFLEEEKEKIYEGVIDTFLRYEGKAYNPKEFIAYYVNSTFEEISKRFLVTFPITENKDIAIEVLKKKYSFKVKSIVEE